MRAAMAAACAQVIVWLGAKAFPPVPFMMPRVYTARTPASYQLPALTSENIPG